jgi:hypothetical protein
MRSGMFPHCFNDYTIYIVSMNSVAKSWPNFSARSTKKFGRWQKSCFFFLQNSQCKITWVYHWKVTILCPKYDCFGAKLNYKKIRLLFDKSAKSSATDFFVPMHFLAHFVLCGRNFGPLATLSMICCYDVSWPFQVCFEPGNLPLLWPQLCGHTWTQRGLQVTNSFIV